MISAILSGISQASLIQLVDHPLCKVPITQTILLAAARYGLIDVLPSLWEKIDGPGQITSDFVQSIFNKHYHSPGSTSILAHHLRQHHKLSQSITMEAVDIIIGSYDKWSILALLDRWNDSIPPFTHLQLAYLPAIAYSYDDREVVV